MRFKFRAKEHGLPLHRFVQWFNFSFSLRESRDREQAAPKMWRKID
jgi:hypothetical protein